ncbi:recombinase family protein [Pontibacillus litoralis]|uniref:Resolvase n=1 Tax=Pontibacillus litoralis JSM 072002 TaxID=1385512 RepID=A0A0A5FYG5_9BACI|nr:recombinase family protein [Pontibacillus litoralis]KGX84839.1 hypothetical protein N784_11725 [Pontibacillus litoralis JSM 072002]
MTKPVAIYARVSTEEQATEGYSIQGQIEEMETYAEQRGMEVVRRYLDEGVSGKNISGRPQMKRLLKDLGSGDFQAVIVYKIDRISRKSKDALEIAERCDQANVKLISLKEDMDITTPMGKMMFQMASNFSEYERNSIIERLKMGMNQRAKQGYYNGGRVYGYDSVNKELVINEEEAHVIQLIFNYAEEDLGYKAIVSRINSMGFKTKRGKDFAIHTIKTILDNPLYIGKIRFNMYENWIEKHRKGKNENYILVDGKHQAIISNEQWERVQKIRKKRSHKPSRSHTPYLLSGLVRCPQFGNGMVPGRSNGGNGKKYRYYVCGFHHNKGKTACRANSIRAERVEESVFEELKRIVAEPYVLKNIVQSVNDKRMNAKDPIDEQIRIHESKLRKIEGRIDNTTTQLMDDPTLAAIFKPKLQEMMEEKASLEQKIEELNVELSECDTAPIDEDALYHLLSNLETILSKSDITQQKALLHLIIKDIQITKDAPRRIGRRVEKINLHFDFTIEGLEHQTMDLLNTMNMDFIKPMESWELESMEGVNRSEVMDSLNILPLNEVRFPSINPKRPVHLL